MIFIGRWYLCQVPSFPALKGKLGAALLPRLGDRPSSGQCGTRAAGINVNSPHPTETIRLNLERRPDLQTKYEPTFLTFTE